MEMWLSSATRDSDAPRSFSSLHSLAKKPPASTTAHSKLSWSATLISEETCTPTLSCPEARPCTLESPREWPKSSRPLLHQQWRLKLLPHQKENTPYGLVALFLPHYLLSNRCGSQKLNMTSLVHPSSTENAFKKHTFKSYFISLWKPIFSELFHKLNFMSMEHHHEHRTLLYIIINTTTFYMPYH